MPPAHEATHGLAPRRWRRFKLSNDKVFAEKLHDVVGLYVDPPAHAILLPVDEKSQIQALDRTQPGLPLKKGRGGAMTHEYRRNGTTTLFAVLKGGTGPLNFKLIHDLKKCGLSYSALVRHSPALEGRNGAFSASVESRR